MKKLIKEVISPVVSGDQSWCIISGAIWRIINRNVLGYYSKTDGKARVVAIDNLRWYQVNNNKGESSVVSGDNHNG
jgi:hypothetical protein